MLVCQVIILILFSCLSNAQDDYYIPEPKIEVLNPKRFQISIEDHPGVTFVAFHVNINEELHRQQIGEFSKEIYHPVDGRWVFKVPSKVHLNAGDAIYYWLFVIQNRMGYTKLGTHTIRRLQNGSFEAAEAVSTESPREQTQEQPASCKTCTLDEQKPISTTFSSSSPQSNKDSSLNYCEYFLLNTTQNLLTLQAQLENMRKYNEQLIKQLEYFPDAKKLILTAKIPPVNDPLLTVKFIIREKLDLNPDIVSAVKISDDSIEFKLATIAEKLEILEGAKEKLADSRFSITQGK